MKCIHELCIFLITRWITSLYSHKWMDFITETDYVSCTAWYWSLNVNQVNVIKEVISSGAWCLVLGKMDTNVSEEFPLPVFRWKRGWKEEVTANYRVSQQERQSGFSFYCFVSFENVTFKSVYTRFGTLIVATIYLQLIQIRYMFRSFTVLQCSHQHCVQPVASDVEVVGYL